MSKITLAPNASGSGTLTIAAPNTNSDYTLTLPTATGTVNTSGSVNEVPAGSAGSPSIYPTGDTNTGIFFPAADTIAFTEGGAEAMRIDSSGNVGIGTSSPGAKLEVSSTASAGRILLNAADLPMITNGFDKFTSGAYNGAGRWGMFMETSQLTLGCPTTGAFTFKHFNADSTSTERMRIDASGNVMLGTTDTTLYNNTSGTGVCYRAGASFDILSASDNALILNRAGSDGGIAEFRKGGTVVGSISVTTTATAYNTSSDYRLKENVQPMMGALDKIAQLNPVTYTWKSDGSDGQGFIAHELQAIVPDCVSGEKDAVDDEGNPKYQGVDTSFLVATLVKAVQEQQQMIQALQADIAALKGV